MAVLVVDYLKAFGWGWWAPLRYGKTPMQSFIDSVSLAKEKMIAA